MTSVHFLDLSKSMSTLRGEQSSWLPVFPMEHKKEQRFPLPHIKTSFSGNLSNCPHHLPLSTLCLMMTWSVSAAKETTLRRWQPHSLTQPWSVRSSLIDIVHFISCSNPPLAPSTPPQHFVKEISVSKNYPHHSDCCFEEYSSKWYNFASFCSPGWVYR